MPRYIQNNESRFSFSRRLEAIQSVLPGFLLPALHLQWASPARSLFFPTFSVDSVRYLEREGEEDCFQGMSQNTNQKKTQWNRPYSQKCDWPQWLLASSEKLNIIQFCRRSPELPDFTKVAEFPAGWTQLLFSMLEENWRGQREASGYGHM